MVMISPARVASTSSVLFRAAISAVSLTLLSSILASSASILASFNQRQKTTDW